jgi:hypothetical protein
MIRFSANGKLALDDKLHPEPDLHIHDRRMTFRALDQAVNRNSEIAFKANIACVPKRLSKCIACNSMIEQPVSRIPNPRPLTSAFIPPEPTHSPPEPDCFCGPNIAAITILTPRATVVVSHASVDHA